MNGKNILIIADTNVHILYNRLQVTVTLYKSNMGFFAGLLFLAAFLYLTGAQGLFIFLKVGFIVNI